MLLLGRAAGTAGGFAYGQTADLTGLDVRRSSRCSAVRPAFTAVAGSRDGKFGGWEGDALALGLDAGVLGGALIAPSLDGSPRRAKLVFARIDHESARAWAIWWWA